MSEEENRNRAVKALKEIFGFEGFRPLQEEAVLAALSPLKPDVFVVLATGAGKSICYQLPALLEEGVTFVVSPLLSLIEDQVKNIRNKLESCGLGDTMLVGSLSDREHDEDSIYKDAKNKKPLHKIVYTTPEKILLGKKRDEIGVSVLDWMAGLYERGLISRFVIDEAHCVTTWGEDFRESYLKLDTLRSKFPEVPIFCATATATRLTVAETARALNLEKNFTLLRGTIDRPNIRMEVYDKDDLGEHGVVRKIWDIIHWRHQDSAGIIYCHSKKDCENLCKALELLGMDSRLLRYYHADMTIDERNKVHHAWLRDEVRVIIATIAFGMGIDKADVRFIIHHTIPKSLFNYWQQVGRAGRDDKESTALMFYSSDDFVRVQQLVENRNRSHSRLKVDSDPRSIREAVTDVSDRRLVALMELVQFSIDNKTCRRFTICEHFGETYAVARCQGTCDNCSREKIRPLYDASEAAQQLVRLVMNFSSQSELETTPTMQQIVQLFRGNNLRKFRNDGFSAKEGFNSAWVMKSTQDNRPLIVILTNDIIFVGGALVKLTESEAKDLIVQCILRHYLRQTIHTVVFEGGVRPVGYISIGDRASEFLAIDFEKDAPDSDRRIGIEMVVGNSKRQQFYDPGQPRKKTSLGELTARRLVTHRRRAEKRHTIVRLRRKRFNTSKNMVEYLVEWDSETPSWVSERILKEDSPRCILAWNVFKATQAKAKDEDDIGVKEEPMIPSALEDDAAGFKLHAAVDLMDFEPLNLDL